jgi:hypothetical protein
MIYTEYFLWFPRERKKYQYVLDIKVSVSLLNVDAIQHETHIQKTRLPEWIKHKKKLLRQVK